MHNLLPAPEEINAEEVEEGYNLTDRVADLEKEIADLRSEMETDRRQTASLFRSIKIVVGNSPASPASSAPSSDYPAESDKWTRLKAKLGGKMAEIIEALQLSSPATTTQIYRVAGGSFSNVKVSVYKLRDMGLIIKNGDGWTLKQ